MSAPKKKRPAFWQKLALSILCGFLSVVLIFMIFATAYVNHLLGKIQVVDPETEYTLSASEIQDILNAWSEATDPPEATAGPDASNPTDAGPGITETFPPTVPPVTIPQTSDKIDQTGVINIMLVGDDRRPDQGRQRSDVMMLCCFNLKNNTLTLISFLRDTWVYIPGYGDNKLNAAYAIGGFSLLGKTIETNYGIKIDGYASTTFTQFEKLIDVLGGVDITLTEKEAQHLNEGNGWSLSAGKQRLSGAQALAYSRIRYIDTDYQRANRQRTVIMSLLDRYKSLSLTQALGLVDDILSIVSVSRGLDVVGLVKQLLPVVATGTVKTQQIPEAGKFTVSLSHGWIEIPDLEANRKILKQIMEATN